MFFRSSLQTPQLLKVHTQIVMSASGANIGPVGQCDLTFRLWNSSQTDLSFCKTDTEVLSYGLIGSVTTE